MKIDERLLLEAEVERRALLRDAKRRLAKAQPREEAQRACDDERLTEAADAASRVRASTGA